MEEGRVGGEGGERGKKNGGYSATFGDVLGLCSGDWRLILFAFICLLLAAFSQVKRFGTVWFISAFFCLVGSCLFLLVSWDSFVGWRLIGLLGLTCGFWT